MGPYNYSILRNGDLVISIHTYVPVYLLLYIHKYMHAHMHKYKQVYIHLCGRAFFE